MPAPTHVERNKPVKTDDHVMGFLDSRSACEALMEAVKRDGLPVADMRSFDGSNGLAALEEMLKGSWGEAEQAFYEQALPELENGHSAVCIAVHDLEQAARIGKLAGALGGRSFTHFGTMVDTGLET